MFSCRHKYSQLSPKGEWHPQLKELAEFLAELNELRDAAIKSKTAKAAFDRQEKDLAMAEAKEAAVLAEVAAKNAKVRKPRAKVCLYPFAFQLI